MYSIYIISTIVLECVKNLQIFSSSKSLILCQYPAHFRQILRLDVFLPSYLPIWNPIGKGPSSYRVSDRKVGRREFGRKEIQEKNWESKIFAFLSRYRLILDSRIPGSEIEGSSSQIASVGKMKKFKNFRKILSQLSAFILYQ